MAVTYQPRSASHAGAATPAACAAKSTKLPRPKPVSVNGVAIPRADIARETQNHPASKPIDAWLAAAQALVVRELLLQAARRLAIVPAPQLDEDGRREADEEALVRQLIEQEVATPVADETACRRTYEAQRARFRSSDLHAVRHILYAAAPGDRGARQRAHDSAMATIATLTGAPELFADLAAVNSACPSRQQGGALGQISRGQTVPEFESALATAPIGEVCSSPVETRFGFHVVLVEARLEGSELPFEVVSSRIASWLGDRARHTAIHQYIAMLAANATIVGIDLVQRADETRQWRPVPCISAP